MTPRQAGLLLAGITALHLYTAIRRPLPEQEWTIPPAWLDEWPCGLIGCPCKGSGE